MHRPAFLTDQDVPDRILVEDRVVDRQDSATGIAEDNLDALVLQGAKKDLGSWQTVGGRHFSGSLMSCAAWLRRDFRRLKALRFFAKRGG